MSEGRPDNGDALRADLRQLRGVVEQLSARVARLEEELAAPQLIAEQSISPDESATPAAETSRLLLNRVAIGCFVLVGALVLRTATRQAWVGPTVGTALGLLYCLLLMVVPRWLEGRRPSWRHGEMLEIAGGLLVPLIVLETVHRTHALGLIAASLSLAGAGLLGSLLGCLRGSAVAVALLLLAQMAALVGLGVVPQHAVWRGGTLVVFVALGLWIAYRHGWSFLRPLVLVPVALILVMAVGGTAARATWAPLVAWPLSGCALAVWLLVALSFALRADRLDSFERVSLPVASLWLCGVAAFLMPTTVRWAALAGGCALLLLLALPGASARRDGATPSVIATASLLLLASLPWTEPTGLALAGSALATQVIGSTRRLGCGAIFSQAMVLAAIAVNLYHGRLLALEHRQPWLVIGTGLLLGLLFLIHYITMVWLDRRHQVKRITAPLSLAGAAVMILLSLRLTAHVLTHSKSLEELALTIAIAVLGLAAMAAGRHWRLRSTTYLGWVAVIAAALKVMAWDMMRLDGAALVGSVLTLGVVATLVSLMQRRPS